MEAFSPSCASKLAEVTSELLRQSPASAKVALTKCLQTNAAVAVAGPVVSEATAAWAKATQPLFVRDEDADGSVAVQVRVGCGAARCACLARSVRWHLLRRRAPCALPARDVPSLVATVHTRLYVTFTPHHRTS